MVTQFAISFEYPSLTNIFRFAILGVDILSLGVYTLRDYRGIVFCVLGLNFALEQVPSEEEGE